MKFFEDDFLISYQIGPVAMEKAGVPRERGLIGVMVMEHEEGRGYIRKMADALARNKKGESAALRDFAKGARQYLNLLTQHIPKENQVLFPMGDRVLSRKVQAKLVEGSEKIEEERIGKGPRGDFTGSWRS